MLLKFKTFFAAVLCTVIAAEALLSAAAADLKLDIGIDSYKNKFIDSLLTCESTWVPQNNTMLVYNANFFFLDLNNDGKKELVAEINNARMGNREAEVYFYDENSNSVSDAGIINIEHLSSAYNSSTGTFMMLNVREQSTFAMGYHDNMTIDFSAGYASANIYSGYQFSILNTASEKTIDYYYSNDSTNKISEEEYNRITEEKTSGSDIFEVSYSTETSDDYSLLSEDEKKEKLSQLYDESSNGMIITTNEDESKTESDNDIESKSESKPETRKYIPPSTYFQEEPDRAVLKKYQKFIHNNLYPKYGYVDKAEIIMQLDYDILNAVNMKGYTWHERNGIIGFDVYDINGDGTDDMVVYIVEFDHNKKSEYQSKNRFKFEYYSLDDNGDVVLINSEYFYEDMAIALDYITCGLLVLKDEIYFYSEMVNWSHYFADGFSYEYRFYKCFDNKLSLKYLLYKEGYGTSGYNVYLEEYSDDNNKTSRTLFDYNSSIGKNIPDIIAESLKTDIGMQKTNKIVNDVITDYDYPTELDDNELAHNFMGNPSYYYDRRFKRSFTYINRPIDSDVHDNIVNQSYKFRSIIDVSANPPDMQIDDDELDDADSKVQDDVQSDVSDRNKYIRRGESSKTRIMSFVIIVVCVLGGILMLFLFISIIRSIIKKR